MSVPTHRAQHAQLPHRVPDVCSERHDQLERSEDQADCTCHVAEELDELETVLEVFVVVLCVEDYQFRLVVDSEDSVGHCESFLACGLWHHLDEESLLRESHL